MRDRQDLWSRYTSWLQRWRIAIFVASALVIGAGGYLAAQLALHSDLSSLLPPSKRSVRDLDVLRTRARSFGNVLIMLEAPSPAAREVAVAALEAELRQLPPALVAQVSLDDNAAARFGWEHRFLFASTDDLRAAREALADRLRTARLAANPLYVDLDDPAPARDTHRLDDLRRRLADAKAAAAAPHARLSPDGTAQLLSMQVTFPSSDVTRSRDVMARVRALATRVEARFPGTKISLAGSINISIYEHDSVIAGMALSAGITLVLVFAALFLYYRSFFSVLGALWALLVGLAFTLGFTKLAIGHLNLLSAFLTAIVVGNGINPGLIVLSRFGEELRAGASPRGAIAPALGGSLHGTLAASLTAAVAYAALIVTDFRGFRHFGIIGGVGMIACWIATYTVLPVTLGWLADRDAIKKRKPPPISDLVARLAPRHGGRVLALAAVIVAVALVVTVRFLTHDPFQKDWRDLQADSAEIVAQHVVDQQMTARFTRNPELSGHSYKLAIAVDRAEQVPDVVARLRADAATRAPGHELFVDIKSIDDLLPPDQDHKLVELAAIRALFDDPAIAQLDDQERADLLELRPPDGITAFTMADLPPELVQLFVEQNGQVGRLIYVKGSPRFSTWNVADRVAFAHEVRALALPPGVVIGGEPLVIADIVESMETDAPLMIVVSIIGSLLVVWLVVGLRRHGIVTMVASIAGVVVMIAACALAGLRVHFLDLIALPITIGIGIDYAVNLAARDQADARDGHPSDARRLLASTGAAVLLCSFTTTVGYGSLLLSSNGGVRAFGLAAILGELSCIAMALLLAPTLLGLRRR